MNKYILVPTKQQLKIMQVYWEKLQILLQKYAKQVFDLEQDLAKETGIDGCEFFSCDGEYVGIGNIERTMKLIQRDKLQGKIK
jgi:hypothetical protein